MTNILQTIAGACKRCTRCTNECAFLSEHGTPGSIAARYLSGSQTDTTLPFQCNLCGLCTSVCPQSLDPSAMFLVLRQQEFARTLETLPNHSGILAYEQKGCSSLYSLYRFPRGCDTVFFPGCTFAGTRPGITRRAYAFLQDQIPGIGIILDCCTKPSHDLGRTQFFTRTFDGLKEVLEANNIHRVVTVCPSCHEIFKKHAPDIRAVTIYEILSQSGPGQAFPSNKGIVTVHDPCVSRFDIPVQDAVRSLIRDMGFSIREMAHSRTSTVCCGEGGAACHVSPKFSNQWGLTRMEEAGRDPVITYCAGCTSTLGRNLQADHILDHLFSQSRNDTLPFKVSRPPMTYANRLILKQRLKKQPSDGVHIGQRHQTEKTTKK
ncbi:MAG: (Fe-S)-binding protein [Pseudomonadota bacterium]